MGLGDERARGFIPAGVLREHRSGVIEAALGAVVLLLAGLVIDAHLRPGLEDLRLGGGLEHLPQADTGRALASIDEVDEQAAGSVRGGRGLRERRRLCDRDGHGGPPWNDLGMSQASAWSNIGSGVGMAWDWIDQYGAAIASLAALATAIVAIVTLIRASEDSRERSRPILIAELRSDPYVPALQYFVVRNAGSTIGREVVVSFEPALEMPANTQGIGAPFIVDRYSAPIATFAPGLELSNVWFSGSRTSEGWEQREPLPETFTARLDYRGPRGKRSYSDTFSLTTDTLRRETFVTSSSSPREQVRTLTKLAPKVVAALEKIAVAVGQEARSREDR